MYKHDKDFRPNYHSSYNTVSLMPPVACRIHLYISAGYPRHCFPFFSKLSFNKRNIVETNNSRIITMLKVKVTSITINVIPNMAHTLISATNRKLAITVSKKYIGSSHGFRIKSALLCFTKNYMAVSNNW